MSKVTRTFTRDELEELDLPHSDHVVETEQIEERRWYTIHHCVFRIEDDGPLWRVKYYSPISELQEHDTWDDAKEITATQVEPHRVSVTKYRPVDEARLEAGAAIYTKTVTAKQWSGDNADELTALMGSDRFDPHGTGQNLDDPSALASFRDDHRGGTWYPLTLGDWVLRDDAGEWHSCPNDRFVATHRAEGAAA